MFTVTVRMQICKLVMKAEGYRRGMEVVNSLADISFPGSSPGWCIG